MWRKNTILFIKFCLVGLSNTAISLVIYYLLLAVGVNYLISMAIGYIVSSICGYIFNKIWVFKQKDAKVQKSIFKYYILYGSSLLVNLLCMAFFVKGLGLSDMIAPILTIIITTIYNFTLSKLWVFKNRPESEDSSPHISFNDIKQDKLLIALAIIFICLVIPLFINNYFNHPVADDYSNYTSLINVMPEVAQNNYSVGDVLLAIPRKALNTYQTWQGTYFANLLFYISPLLISINAYKIAMFLIQLFWIIGTWFFFSSLPKHSKKQYLANLKLFLIFMIFGILSMYSLGEGLYWFTGSILYIIPFTMSLIFFGALIRFFRKQSKPLIITLFLLAIALAGTSYVTGIVVGFILLLVAVNQFCGKTKFRLFSILLLLAFCIGFAFNVFCPGNFVRIDSFEKVPLLTVIKYSIGNAIDMSKYFMFSTLFIPLLIISLPSLYTLAQNNHTPHAKKPILFAILCACCFVATFVPMAYSYGSPYQETRVENIQLLYLSLLTGLCVFYYLATKKRPPLTASRINQFAWCGIVAAILMISAIGLNNITGILMLDDVFYGNSHSHDLCMDTIENQLRQPTTEVTISNCEVHPSSLLYYYMAQDSWQTKALEEYYNKKIIINEEK